MNKLRLIFIVVLLGIFTDSYADTCPSPEKIRNRDLSKKYEWTVDETTTLQNLLSVKRLYAVRIMDQDAYVSCHYTTDKWPVKLDLAPVSGACKLAAHGGKWKNTDAGQVVCLEKDPGKCNFSFACKQEQ